MPATTEKIVEQINVVKDQIGLALKEGKDTSALVQQHDSLMRQLSAASQALTENKQILKG